MVPRSLKKAFLCCKTGWRLGGNLHLKGQKNNLQWKVFQGKYSKKRGVQDKKKPAISFVKLMGMSRCFKLLLLNGLLL